MSGIQIPHEITISNFLLSCLPALSQLQNMFEKVVVIFFARFQLGQDQGDEGVHVVVDDCGGLAGVNGEEGEQLLQHRLLDGAFLVVG